MFEMTFPWFFVNQSNIDYLEELPEPMLINCQFDPWEQTSMKF